MGKSISPLYFHNAVNSGPALILTGAWIPGAAGLAGGNVFIIKETGEKRYLVTDGAVTGEVYLIDSANATSGQGWIQIADSDEFVTKIYENVVVTNKGNSFPWSIDAGSKTADVILPSSIFPAQATVLTAVIAASSPDKLTENADKTLSEDMVDFTNLDGELKETPEG